MYIIDANADEPIMLLNKFIGFSSEEGQGIDGATFQRELFELDNMGKKCIHVYINCPGGDVIEGMSIYNAILKTKTPVDTHNVGIAASMGAAIFMAGRKRYMADYAKFMIHNPSGGTDKTALAAFTDSVCKMTSSKCGIEETEVLNFMKAESWFGAAECFEKGFCTEVENTNQKNKKWTGDARTMWAMGDAIVANIFKTENNMKKVTAKLQLNTDASEDAILAAIEGIEAKASVTALALAAATENITALTTERDTLKLKAETLEQTNKDNEAAALKVKAETMVKVYAEQGRIKNEEAIIAKWVALAEKDFDSTEETLKELPLNKTAEKITSQVTTTTGLGISAAARMIEIANRPKK